MDKSKTGPLVWVTDKKGNRFLCPAGSLMDPNTVSEEEKASCLDDASGVAGVAGQGA